MRSLLLLGLVFVQASLFGQALPSVPEVDTAAVIRRGDHVEHVNGIQSEVDAAWGEVTSPPADDSHKWFITVLTTKNCGPCAKLKADWQTSEYLKAFAIPGDQKNSWAHINFYDAEDETHSWFQKHIKISGYPTILIQPPRSKQYGDPTTVVFQKTGYNGKPEDLAAKMSAGMKTYVAKLAQHRSSYAIQKREAPQSGGYRASSEDGSGVWGQIEGPPPFNVPGPNTPSPAVPPPLNIPDAINPDVQPQPTPAPPDAPAPTPKTPESVMSKRSICVVVDSNSVESEEKMAGRKRLLSFLRQQNPGVEPSVITTEQAKTKFPGLDTTEPQVIMTGFGGKLLTQIPQSIIDKWLEEQPELQAVGTVVKTIGALLPTIPQMVLLGVFGAYLVWRKSRKPATPATPADPNAPAAPAFGDGRIIKEILEALKGLKKE